MTDYGPGSQTFIQNQQASYPDSPTYRTTIPAPEEDTIPPPTSTPAQYAQRGGKWTYFGGAWRFLPAPTPEQQTRSAIVHALFGSGTPAPPQPEVLRAHGDYASQPPAPDSRDVLMQQLMSATQGFIPPPTVVVGTGHARFVPAGQSYVMRWDPKDFDLSRWGGPKASGHPTYVALPGDPSQGYAQSLAEAMRPPDVSKPAPEMTIDPRTGKAVPGWPGMTQYDSRYGYDPLLDQLGQSASPGVSF